MMVELHHGGAIYTDSSIELILYFVTFLFCSSSSRGGCITTRSPLYLKMNGICFINCSAYVCPSFSLDGWLYSNNRGELNYSSESSPINTFHGSQLVSNSCIINSMNFSNCKADSYSPNIFIGSINNENIFIYSQITNSNGKTFFCYQVLLTSNIPIILNNNFINNTISNGWFEIHRIPSNPIISKCFFIGNYLYPPIYHTISSSGYLTFLNCLFSFENNNIYSIDINQNSFNLNQNYLYILHFTNNFYCLNNYSKINSINLNQNSKNFKFLFYFLLNQ